MPCGLECEDVRFWSIEDYLDSIWDDGDCPQRTVWTRDRRRVSKPCTNFLRTRALPLSLRSFYFALKWREAVNVLWTVPFLLVVSSWLKHFNPQNCECFLRAKTPFTRVGIKFERMNFLSLQAAYTEPVKFCYIVCRLKTCTVPRVPHKRKADLCKFLSVQTFVQTRVNRVFVRSFVLSWFFIIKRNGISVKEDSAQNCQTEKSHNP